MRSTKKPKPLEWTPNGLAQRLVPQIGVGVSIGAATALVFYMTSEPSAPSVLLVGTLSFFASTGLMVWRAFSIGMLESRLAQITAIAQKNRLSASQVSEAKNAILTQWVESRNLGFRSNMRESIEDIVRDIVAKRVDQSMEGVVRGGVVQGVSESIKDFVLDATRQSLEEIFEKRFGEVVSALEEAIHQIEDGRAIELTRQQDVSPTRQQDDRAKNE